MEQSHSLCVDILDAPIGKGDVMNCRACIQASLDYIEDHLKDDLTAEILARIAGFSPYHYSRMFQAYVSKPVMEYIIPMCHHWYKEAC